MEPRIQRSAALPTALAIGLLGLFAVACDDDGDGAGDAPPSAEEIRDSGGGSGAGGPTGAVDDADGGASSAAPGAGPDGSDAGTEPGTGTGTEPRTETVYSVQLGAFTQEANARALRERLDSAGLPVWVVPAEISGRSYTRVRVAAASSVAEARGLLERLRDDFGGDGWVAPVAPDEPLPSGIPEASESLLREG